MTTIKNILNWTKNVIVLYLLWILFSLPIITIGASTTAAYYVALKLLDKNQPPLFKTFVKAFKSNFFEGTFIYILVAAVGFACYKIAPLLDPDYVENLLIVLAVIAMILAYLYSLYIFPITSHYINKFYRNLESSLLLCTHHPILFLSITAFTGIFVLVYHFNHKALIPLLVAGYPLYFWFKAIICSYMFNKQEQLVKKQQEEKLREQQNQEEDTDKDCQD